MSIKAKPACDFKPRYDNEGGLMRGECACGKIFYPFTNDRKKRDEALKYMEQQYREHHDERYRKIDE